jgi:hypothetical protein
MKLTSTYIKGILCALFHTFLALIIPKQRKRLFLIATLHYELARKGAFHKRSIDELNETLHLADNDKMLLLPEPIYEMVWDSEKLASIVAELPTMYDGETCLQFKDADRISEDILRVTPDWLRYASLDVMKNDIIGLFYCQPLKTA